MTQTFGVTTVDFGPQPLQEYAAHYGALDTGREFLNRSAPGELLISQQRFSSKFIARDEYHQDFLRRYGLKHRLGVCLLREDGQDYYLALLRPDTRGEFSRPDIDRLRALTPHLQNATALYQRTRRLRELAALGEHVFDLMGFGVVTLDSRRRILFANRFAAALLAREQVLTQRHGVLRALNPAHDTQLSATMTAVTQHGHAASLRIRGGTPAQLAELNLTIARMPPDGDPIQAQLGGRLLVIVHEATRKRALTEQQLNQLFGLSAAEAKLARALAQGLSLETYASRHNLKMTTVRTQLRSVFGRTGCPRQTVLVRLLVGIPAVR